MTREQEIWLEDEWKDRIIPENPGSYEYLIYVLLDHSRFVDDTGYNTKEEYTENTWNDKVIEAIELCRTNLKAYDKYRQKRYDWMRNQTILDYLTAPDYDLFLIGFQLLRQKKVL